MSSAVYPSTLMGLTPTMVVAPKFNTRVQRAVSGRETRASFMQYPLWELTVSYEFLRSNTAYPELDTIMGFFLARKGSLDSFLVAVPNDQSCTDMRYGTGDGTTKIFQLTRTRGAGGFGLAEPVMNPLAVALRNNGADVSAGAYTLSSTGVVTFGTAPASGVALTWTGTYYYRCRFLQDQMDFSRFMQDLYELKKVQMVGAVGNRV